VAKVRADQYNGRVTVHVILACIVAATGGSLFGYDVGISGSVLFHSPNFNDFIVSTFTFSFFYYPLS